MRRDLLIRPQSKRARVLRKMAGGVAAALTFFGCMTFVAFGIGVHFFSGEVFWIGWGAFALLLFASVFLVFASPQHNGEWTTSVWLAGVIAFLLGYNLFTIIGWVYQVGRHS